MPDRVRITDVSPRDGLQNEPGVIPSSEKSQLAKHLVSAGVNEVEITSFVSPKWVPQLGDGEKVLWEAAASKGPEVLFSALVPNMQGLDAALAAARRAQPRVHGSARALDKVAVFAAASETFSHRNINASIAESLERYRPVIAEARRLALIVRGYVSCAIACPFEGPIKPEKVAQVAQALHDMGCDEIDLGDTIGAAEPETITFLIHAMIARLGEDIFKYTTLHLHDTFGRAAECVREALQLGIRSFDGSVAGLGGCPYASTPTTRAPGNISTELLVRTVQAAGYETSVSLAKLEEAAAFARSIVAKARGGAGAPT